MTLEARRDARERVSGPGKFEGESPMAVILYEASMISMQDDEESDGVTWYARLGRRIIWEYDNGSVSYMRYATVAEAESIMDELHDFVAEEDDDYSEGGL